MALLGRFGNETTWKVESWSDWGDTGSLELANSKQQISNKLQVTSNKPLFWELTFVICLRFAA